MKFQLITASVKRISHNHTRERKNYDKIKITGLTLLESIYYEYHVKMIKIRKVSSGPSCRPTYYYAYAISNAASKVIFAILLGSNYLL